MPEQARLERDFGRLVLIAPLNAGLVNKVEIYDFAATTSPVNLVACCWTFSRP